ncbi:polycomb group protein Psc-like [Ixodes scapularis]
MPRALLRDLNAALSCMLCGGYLVNAATLVDCLHSFCKVCIVRYLDTSKLCPICDVPVHKSRPLSCLRLDRTLQDIVYKVVPGLYQREMKQRQEFYDQHPDAAFKVPCLEDRGVVDVSSRLIFSPQDTVSVSLEYFTGTTEAGESEDDGKEDAADAADGEGTKDPKQGLRRFLSCPAAFTISHMQKFLRTKYALSPSLKARPHEVVALGAYQINHVWAVTLNSPEATKRLLAVNELKVKGRRCLIIDQENQQLKLKLHWVLHGVTDDDIRMALDAYGKLTEVAKERWRIHGVSQKDSTSRTVLLKLKVRTKVEDVPHQIRIADDVADNLMDTTEAEEAAQGTGEPLTTEAEKASQGTGEPETTTTSPNNIQHVQETDDSGRQFEEATSAPKDESAQDEATCSTDEAPAPTQEAGSQQRSREGSLSLASKRSHTELAGGGQVRVQQRRGAADQSCSFATDTKEHPDIAGGCRGAAKHGSPTRR